jgi:hypothetical protein
MRAVHPAVNDWVLFQLKSCSPARLPSGSQKLPTSKLPCTLNCFRLDLLHHETQVGQGWTLLRPRTHASFDNGLERRWNRPFDEGWDRPICVNHAFDTVSNVIYVGSTGPTGVLQASMEGNLGR